MTTVTTSSPSAPSSRAAPSPLSIVGAIVQRELRTASGRRLVRALFLVGIVPCIVFALVLVVRVAGEAATGSKLDWDPVGKFLDIQAVPVLLMALGLGTPIVAQDRAEDVLFLYATRPVRPVDYCVGKLLAVAVPCTLLLLVPALLMAALRMGILPNVTTANTLVVVGKATLVSLLVGVGYAGMTVGASALTSRARWALLLSLGLIAVPDIIRAMASLDVALGPTRATTLLIGALFADVPHRHGWAAAALLVLVAALGSAVLVWRARREMTP